MIQDIAKLTQGFGLSRAQRSGRQRSVSEIRSTSLQHGSTVERRSSRLAHSVRTAGEIPALTLTTLPHVHEAGLTSTPGTFKPFATVATPEKQRSTTEHSETKRNE